MRFPETRWTLVLQAGLDTEEGRDALGRLCHQYKKPLISYLTRFGIAMDAAEEFVQSFFLKVVETRLIDEAAPSRGRLRNFLLVALKRSVANDLRHASAIKRGGKAQLLSVDTFSDSDLDQAISLQAPSPDQVFHREWALQLLERSVDEVEEKYRRANKQVVFRVLSGALAWREDALDREAAARELGVQPGHLRVLVYRLREDFRAALRRQVLDTIADSTDLELELRELSKVLAGSCNGY